MISFKLAEIFCDGMIVQRDKDIAVFGEGEPGDKIAIKFIEGQKNTDEVATTVDSNGKWIGYLPKKAAGMGFSLEVSVENSDKIIRVEDVAVGDVYLAGGQSNMEFFNKYDKDWEKTKNLPINENIRMFNVPQRAFEGHNTHNRKTRGGYGYWFKDKDKGYENFSAPAYSFARLIQPEIGVPVGLIGCNWGGSTASAWVDKSVLQNDELRRYLDEYDKEVEGKDIEAIKEQSMKGWEQEDNDDNYLNFEPLLYGRDLEWQADFMERTKGGVAVPMGPYNFNRPCGLYEYMLKPIMPYALNGVLWYQGESDSGDRAPMYDKLLTGMINNWRKDWNDDFSFFIVQLAPFGKWLDCVNDGYALVRQMQQKVADTVSGVYMASIMDIGSTTDIHPKEKMEVGRRLGLLALKYIYEKDILADAPRAVSAVCEGDFIKISFNNAKGLKLCSDENTLRVVSDDKEVTVKSIGVENDELVIELNEHPLGSKVAVELGIGGYAVINIKNEAGLPIAPFSIDVVVK